HVLLVKIVGFEHMHIAVEDLVTVARHGVTSVMLIANIVFIRAPTSAGVLMTFLDRLALIERRWHRCGAGIRHRRQDQQKILAPSRKGWKTASHNLAHD
ncbi:MAG: hypothetical protein ACXW6K_17415, partial [Candidatus Binatia bacterium]